MANKTDIYNSIVRQYKDLRDGTFAEIVASPYEQDVATDAFGRVRISDTNTVFESVFQYSKLPLIWGESLSGAATSTHILNESCINMSVTTASGDKVIRQTHKYFRYQPGKSHLVLLTAVLGASKPNLRTRLGYFDGQNGVFFENTAEGIHVVQRSFSSGTAVDTRLSQSNWNLDKLDGTGLSGTTLDLTKSQIFIIDFGWLGVGRVRFGIYSENKIVYCHEFHNSNSLLTVFMSTANLPIRSEIENIGVTPSASVLKQICSSISSEGGRDLPRAPIESSISNGISLVAVTTRRPILSMAPKYLINGVTNRGYILPGRVSVLTRNNDCFFEIIRNGTLGGTPSWTSAGANSITEYDTSATTISGGDIAFSGFVPASLANSSASIDARMYAQDLAAMAPSIALSLNWDATSRDILSVVVTSFTGTTNASSTMETIEVY
ncbi:MAG: hypothetical protein A3F67_08065 [Verrucomicrobia bacterium RIFCSPHIGHO2_12_FULL_41_10]|nr:MAG: hypothetical protein A3F67_08065 [Verrucomicrobia bacterium RIFCSPHIGHO2_12_FULL_41_10]